MIKKIAIVLVLAVAGLLVYATLQPSDMRIQRRILIAAPSALIFDQINNFHNWEAWSPWAKLDPHVKNTFEGPASGNGAVFAWSGNSEVGEGRMTIVDSYPPSSLNIKLEFLKPFESNATAAFTVQPVGDKAELIWTMDGSKNLVCRIVGIFVNMDDIVGGQFEQGLQAIKKIAEASALGHAEIAL